MTTEIHINSNIGPPSGENDSEKSHEDSNHDSRDPGKDGEGVSDSYVHLVPEMHNTTADPSTLFHKTESQKHRRKLIPFKYHSKIFKKSKKKTGKNGNHLSPVEKAVPRKQAVKQNEVENHRLSTVSSSYASCRPHGRDVSCHTYVDIEDMVDLRDNRDMELERCNSISTVSTLPMITLQPPDEESIETVNGGRGRRQFNDIQEEPPSSMVHRIHYEMKPPSKTKRMKKYMILFSVVLLFVVFSTVLAGYVGTKKVVDDIPTIVEKQVQKLSGLESIEISLFNISENQDDFNQDLLDFKNGTILINKQHLKRLENARETDIELIRNETKKTNDLFLEQFMNNTDLLSWKDDVKHIMYNLIHRMYCVDNCIGKNDSHYQSCTTCNRSVKLATSSQLLVAGYLFREKLATSSQLLVTRKS